MNRGEAGGVFMADEVNIQKTGMNGVFEKCPDCGYGKGFHSAFYRDGGGGAVRWVLVCPGCGARYDLGMVVSDLMQGN